MITIVLPVSRPEFLEKILGRIELLECNQALTNIIAIVDGDDSLYVHTRNLITETKYAQKLTVKYKAKTKLRQYDVFSRRLRIADIHNEVKKYIDNSEFIFGIEDDTMIPTTALRDLMGVFIDHPSAGIVQGVELGRWGIPYIGAWRTDNVYEPTYLESVDKSKNIEKIDCGGMYCFLTRFSTYKSHLFKPFENNDLGPDVNFGISLRRLGYENYINWDVSCGHLTKDNNIALANTEPRKVQFYKINNNWEIKY